MNHILYKDEVFAIQGAIFEVNRELGSGFLEAVYQECLMLEFERRSIPFAAHKEIGLSYKGRHLAQTYRADFICYDQIIIELKACENLSGVHRAQLLNYLTASQMRLGLLVNFGSHPKAQVERMAL